MTDHPHPPAKESGEMKKETKILIGAIAAAIVIVIIAAVLTFTVNVSDSASGGSLPYGTHYKVTLPDGEAVTIGNSRISVMAYGDSVMTSVDDKKEQLMVGQTRVISPRHAVISMLGFPVYQTDFQITLQYLGSTGTKDNFELEIATSTQVPAFLLDRLLPASVNAQPA